MVRSIESKLMGFSTAMSMPYPTQLMEMEPTCWCDDDPGASAGSGGCYSGWSARWASGPRAWRAHLCCCSDAVWLHPRWSSCDSPCPPHSHCHLWAVHLGCSPRDHWAPEKDIQMLANDTDIGCERDILTSRACIMALAKFSASFWLEKFKP